VKQSLLAIVAHPDDESYSIGGTLAKYSAEGRDVNVLVATDGASGTISQGDIERHKPLESIRANEMRQAAKVLGVTLHWLGYRDSGMAGDVANNHPNAFIQADKAVVAEQVYEIMSEIKPDVVITHDKNGGYFHPDHIFCSEITTSAYRMYIGHDATQHLDNTLPGLYYFCLPKWWIELYIVGMKLKGDDPTKWGHNQNLDVTNVGVPMRSIQVKVDVTQYWDAKREACARHQSQGGDKFIYFHPLIPKWLQKAVFGKEFFQKAGASEINHQVQDFFEFSS